MAPQSSPRSDRAVAKVLAGECGAAKAAKLCGPKPHELQNVRKRVREERERRATAAADAAAAQRAQKKRKPSKEPNANAKEKPNHNLRHTVHQVDVINEAKHKWKHATIDAYKGATTAYQALLAVKRKRGDGGADDIAERFNAELPADAKPLTGQSTKNQVIAGRAGLSPVRPGPARSLPQVAYDTVATFIQMRQISGDEQKPRALSRAAKAALKGTQWACKVETSDQIKRVLQHVREDHADLISRGKKCTVDDRRWLWWTTHSNLSTWYDGWKEFLLEAEFAEDKSQKLPGGRTAEITTPPQKLRRIMNSDETHHKLSNEGDRGGSRATSWVNRRLGRSGKRKAAAAGHVTGLYTTTAGRQNGPAMFFFSSDAENPENCKVQTPWLVGLPRVRYEMPNGQIVVVPSHAIATPKSGMTGDAFEHRATSEFEFDSDSDVS